MIAGRKFHVKAWKNDIAYADEPLADEEWLKKYKDDETNKLEQELREGLEGSFQVGFLVGVGKFVIWSCEEVKA